MRSERGQGTVEWIGVVLVVAIALAALGRVAPGRDDRALGATLVHSMTCAARDGCGKRTPAASRPSVQRIQSAHEGFSVPALIPTPGRARPRTRLPRPGSARPGTRLPRTGQARSHLRLPGARQAGLRLRLPPVPAVLRRARRGAGTAWRRAWIACLVYERFRYAFMHPESRFPGHTIPPSEVLRMINDCISPLDLVRDWPALSDR
jgi:hypothetical protein